MHGTFCYFGTWNILFFADRNTTVQQKFTISDMVDNEDECDKFLKVFSYSIHRFQLKKASKWNRFLCISGSSQR